MVSAFSLAFSLLSPVGGRRAGEVGPRALIPSGPGAILGSARMPTLFPITAARPHPGRGRARVQEPVVR